MKKAILLATVLIWCICSAYAQKTFYFEFDTPLSDIVVQVEEDIPYTYALINSFDFSKNPYYAYNTTSFIVLNNEGRMVKQFDYENKDTVTVINRFLVLPDKRIMLMADHFHRTNGSRLGLIILDSNLHLVSHRIYGRDSLAYYARDAKVIGDTIIICGGLSNAFVFLSNTNGDSLANFNYHYKLSSGLLFFEQIIDKNDNILTVNSHLDPLFQHKNSGSILVTLRIDSGTLISSVQPRSLKTINFHKPGASKGYFEYLNDTVIIVCGEAGNVVSQGLPAQYGQDALLIVYDLKNKVTLRDYFFGIPDYYDVISGRSFIRYDDDLIINTSVTRYPDSVKYYLYLVRTDLYGNKKWEKTYDYNKNCYNFNALKSIDGGFYICGGTEQSIQTRHQNKGAAFIIKFDSSGTAPAPLINSTGLFSETGRVQVYPNPTNRFVNIEFENDIEIKTMQLTDLSGKICLEISSPVFPMQLDIDALCLSPGTYFLRLNGLEYSRTSKIVIIAE